MYLTGRLAIDVPRPLLFVGGKGDDSPESEIQNNLPMGDYFRFSQMYCEIRQFAAGVYSQLISGQNPGPELVRGKQ